MLVDYAIWRLIYRGAQSKVLASRPRGLMIVRPISVAVGSAMTFVDMLIDLSWSMFKVLACMLLYELSK